MVPGTTHYELLAEYIKKRCRSVDHVKLVGSSLVNAFPRYYADFIRYYSARMQGGEIKSTSTFMQKYGQPSIELIKLEFNALVSKIEGIIDGNDVYYKSYESEFSQANHLAIIISELQKDGRGILVKTENVAVYDKDVYKTLEKFLPSGYKRDGFSWVPAKGKWAGEMIDLLDIILDQLGYFYLSPLW